MNARTTSRNGNAKLVLIAIIVVAALVIIRFRGTVEVKDLVKIKADVPPTGTPIRVKLKAELGNVQTEETINIEFRHAGFPDKVCSVTLGLTSEKPEAEQTITFPCQGTYDFTITGISRLTFNGAPVQGNGTGQGSLVFKGDETILYRRVVAGETTRTPGPNGQFRLTMPYRCSLNPDAPNNSNVAAADPK